MYSFFSFLIGLILIFAHSNAFGQREQLILKTEIFPSVDVELPNGDGSVAGFSSLIAVGNRSVLNEKGTAVLTTTLQYRNVMLNYEGTLDPSRALTPDVVFNNYLIENGMNLHLIQADFLLMKVLNKKWMLYGLARPAVMSDFGDPDFQDFRVEAAVFTEYRFGSKFRGGLGISRSSAFGRILWIPLARVVYRPARQFLIEGVLPSRLDAWYLPSKNWEIGLGLALLGGQFRVGDSELTSIGADQFGWANGVAALQVKRLLSGKWYAQVDAGLSIVPRQEFTEYDYRVFPTREMLWEGNPAPTPVFRAGIFKVF